MQLITHNSLSPIFFFYLELAAYFHQVDGVGHYVLGFLYHSQVYHADFDAAALALDALQLFAFQVRQLSVEVVGFANLA